MLIRQGLLFSILLSSAFFSLADGLPENTNISEQVQAFFQAFENSEDAKNFTEEDWAIFEKDKKELAEKMPDPGLHVGDKAPDFTLNNAFGMPVTLSSLYNKGPVILVFYRGAWCAICNIQLHSLSASLPEFKKYGAQLLAVTPQKPSKSKEQILKDGYPFEVVSDLDYKILNAYKLYFEVPKYLSDIYKQKFGIDIEAHNGDGRFGLPVPATYIIDKAGVIRAAYANTDYTVRMEPSDILLALKDL